MSSISTDWLISIKSDLIFYRLIIFRDKSITTVVSHGSFNCMRGKTKRILVVAVNGATVHIAHSQLLKNNFCDHTFEY